MLKLASPDVSWEDAQRSGLSFAPLPIDHSCSIWPSPYLPRQLLAQTQATPPDLEIYLDRANHRDQEMQCTCQMRFPMHIDEHSRGPGCGRGDGIGFWSRQPAG